MTRAAWRQSVLHRWLILQPNYQKFNQTEEIMNHIIHKFTLISSGLKTNKGRTVIAILTIALFVLSAGAPNATIGIGK